jgi:hypothetical protein
MSDLQKAEATEVAPKASKKKTSAPVVEEAPVEETPVEDVVEEPTPEVTEAE